MEPQRGLVHYVVQLCHGEWGNGQHYMPASTFCGQRCSAVAKKNDVAAAGQRTRGEYIHPAQVSGKRGGSDWCVDSPDRLAEFSCYFSSRARQISNGRRIYSIKHKHKAAMFCNVAGARQCFIGYLILVGTRTQQHQTMSTGFNSRTTRAGGQRCAGSGGGAVGSGRVSTPHRPSHLVGSADSQRRVGRGGGSGVGGKNGWENGRRLAATSAELCRYVCAFETFINALSHGGFPNLVRPGAPGNVRTFG